MKFLSRALLVLVIFLSACTTSKRVVLPDMQRSALPSVNVDEYVDRYPEAPVVYLDVDVTAEHVATKDDFGATFKWELYETVQQRYVVLDAEDEEYTRFELDAAPEDLQTLSLRLRRPDGTVETFGVSDLTETSRDGEPVVSFTYPNVVEGTIIEEVYDMRSDMPGMYYSTGLQRRVPIEKFLFTFAYPDWWEIDVKDMGSGEELDLKPWLAPDDNKQYLKYEATDLRGIKDEPFSPFYQQMADYFQSMITSADFGDGREITGYENWLDMGEAVREQFVDKDPLLSRRVRKTTEDLTDGATTDFEKAQRLLSYVSTEITLDSESRAMDFSDVIREGEGSPYLVNGLLTAMLERAGMEARFLLVHTAQDGYFDSGYVSPQQVSVPAVRVMIDGKEVYLFPFLEDLPMGLVPEPLQGQPALAVGVETSIELTKLPRVRAAEFASSESYTVDIAEDGGVTVTEDRVLRGTEAYSVRKSLEEMTDEERTDYLKETVTYEDGELEWDTHTLGNLDAYGEPLKMTLSYTINNLVTVTPEEVIFQTSGLFSSLSGRRITVDPSKRQNPVSIAYPQQHEQEIDIRYPDAWTLQTDVEDVSVENQFGSVESTVALGESELTASSTLILEAGTHPSDTFTDLLDLIGANSRLTIPTLIFSTQSEM